VGAKRTLSEWKRAPASGIAKERMVGTRTPCNGMACVLAATFPFLPACHGVGPYGHAKIYAAASAEEKAVAGNKEYDPLLAERALDKVKGRSVWLFGVVTNRGPGPGGATNVALSLRSLQQRNLCESDDEDSCRVTVSEREMGRAHALLALASEDDMGHESVGLGSLLRVVGSVTQDLDPNDGTPILRASYYRHWPRGYYVTTKASSFMKH
jgi:hypothetical protein